MPDRRRRGKHEQNLDFSPRSTRDERPRSSKSGSRRSSTRSILPELRNLSLPESTWKTTGRPRTPYPIVPQLILSQNSTTNASPPNAESFLDSPKRDISPRSFGLPKNATGGKLNCVDVADATEHEFKHTPGQAKALPILTLPSLASSKVKVTKATPGREKRRKKEWTHPQIGRPGSHHGASSDYQSTAGSIPNRLTPRPTPDSIPIRKSPRETPGLKMGHSVRPLSRTISMGIEVEFELAAKSSDLAGETIEDFAASFARRFNVRRHSKQLPMRGRLRDYDERDYLKWCLVEEPTVNLHDSSPWGIELVTPVLTAVPASPWREDVASMWHFIHQHYEVTQTSTCATHIHICLDPPVIVIELRKICQAFIHFEPAIWALLPENRRTNIYARSNWLHSPFLAQQKRSRPDSIAFIGRQSSRADIIRAMQVCGERELAWNLSPLTSPGKGTIEFRAPGPSLNADDSLAWAEFVMTFVRAALACSSSRELQTFNPTIGGLRSFLTCSEAQVPEVSQPARLQRIWGNSNENAWVEPEAMRSMDGEFPLSTLLTLEGMLAQDRARISRLTGVSPLKPSKTTLRRSRTLSRLDHLGALGS